MRQVGSDSGARVSVFGGPGGCAAEARPRPGAWGGSVERGHAQCYGTVKKATDKGLVVVGRETGQKDKEWAFVFDAGTRIDGRRKVGRN